MLETGFQIDSLHRSHSFTTYESHVLFALRFMIDCSISGGNWVELKAGAYKLLSLDDTRKQSHCQLEVHVNYRDIISHPAEGQQEMPATYDRNPGMLSPSRLVMHGSVLTRAVIGQCIAKARTLQHVLPCVRSLSLPHCMLASPQNCHDWLVACLQGSG